MSEYRDSLPDEATRARYDEAVAEAGRILAHINRGLGPGVPLPAEQAA